MADVNHDGKLDLITDSGVLLGSGDGTFKSAIPYDASGDSVALGDFSGDGNLDIVVANHSGNKVSVLFGNGDGTFRREADYPVASPNSVAVGDFDSDGRVDLIIANGTTTITVLLGNGNGTFPSAITYPSPAGPIDLLAVGDFNEDHKLDLVVTSNGAVEVLLGNGNGTFQTAVTIVPASYLDELAGITVGDFNGDGKSDVLVGKLGVFCSNNTGGESYMTVFLGNGDGTFRDGGQVEIGVPTQALALGDFNGDGQADLALVAKQTSRLFLVMM